MAASYMPWLRRVVISGKFHHVGCLRLPRMLICPGQQGSTRLYCDKPTDYQNGVDISYENGLPVFCVPLPSRGERCRFTLRPSSDCLHQLVSDLQLEDPGIDRVAAYHTDGTRIAKSTPIDILLQTDFDLEINAQRYRIATALPAEISNYSGEFSQVKNSIAQLYSTLNIEQYQLDRERHLQEKLEKLRVELLPYEQKKLQIEADALRRTTRLQWLGLGLMGLQFGVLARLTWWEYSWDIMEPVTYFITYGTAIAMYAYYVLTKQEYNFKEVCDREFLLSLHRNAAKSNLHIAHYNELRDKILLAENDLQRLRDPLQLQLPIRQLVPKSSNSQL